MALYKTFEIPVTIGELIDKLSILRIKIRKSSSEFVIWQEKQLTNKLIEITSQIIDNDEYDKLYKQLHDINSELWILEDQIRSGGVGISIIADAADKIAKLNDSRATIKNQLNHLFGSPIENKQYN